MFNFISYLTGVSDCHIFSELCNFGVGFFLLLGSVFSASSVLFDFHLITRGHVVKHKLLPFFTEQRRK